jgi:uncharacterized protein YneF (UPF0154 family)
MMDSKSTVVMLGILITGIYVLVMFVFGLYVARRDRREKAREAKEHTIETQ